GIEDLTPDFDCVLGIGGGTAMDIAKLVVTLSDQPGEAIDYVRDGRALEKPRMRTLILVPTTAGTGSEVTSFATVYVDGIKCSLDHPWVRSDYALVDPMLT